MPEPKPMKKQLTGKRIVDMARRIFKTQPDVKTQAVMCDRYENMNESRKLGYDLLADEITRFFIRNQK